MNDLDKQGYAPTATLKDAFNEVIVQASYAGYYPPAYINVTSGPSLENLSMHLEARFSVSIEYSGSILILKSFNVLSRSFIYAPLLASGYELFKTHYSGFYHIGICWIIVWIFSTKLALQ